MPAPRRRPRRNRHYRIDHELKPQDLSDYRDYLREPRTTTKSAHAWLVARGYGTFSESAVARHKRHFLEQHAERDQSLEQARQWALVARDVRRDGGDVVDGAVVLTEVMACRALFAAGTEDVSDADLAFFGKLVSRLVQTRVRLSRLQRATPYSLIPGGAAASAEAMSEEQRHEEMLKETCRILRTPYHTPEERAASAKAWQEFEQRRLAGGPPAEEPGVN